jgi:hypothetical protein
MATNEKGAIMKTSSQNPFTPTFGSVPPLMAGRDILIKDILEGLDNAPGDPNRATIFIGARGTGKTALLTKITNEASINGWICVNVYAENGMLDEILIQVRKQAKEHLTPESLTFINSITIAGAGISRDMKQSVNKASWRSEITSVIEELNEKDIGLLITVDEVNVKIDEMKSLVRVFQHFVREEREAALIMAGLPTRVSDLLNDDDVSFLRRAFQHNLGPIQDNEVRFSIKKTIELAGRKIENDALDYAVKSTKGFAFMIQLIGYHMWRQNPENEIVSFDDAQEGVILAQGDLERMIFGSTFRELSDKDVAFLVAMLEDEEYSNISDIAKRMNVTSKLAGLYRKRLIEHGIIGSVGHGKVAFDLPMFREYLQEKTKS